MDEPPGRRERKRRQTQHAICDAATTLMLDRGFAKVSVADIAEAADVSKMTVFNHFATKEEIVLCQIADHIDESARVVRERQADESPLAALRRHFLERLRAGDPASGLTSDERVLAFRRLIVETPTLARGFAEQLAQSEARLAQAFAEALGAPDDDVTAAMAAAQVASVQRTLAHRNLTAALTGRSMRGLARRATAEAKLGFDLLDRALAATPLAAPRHG